MKRPLLPANADLIPMQARASDASRLLKALANTERLRVLCLLLEREMSVGEINKRLPDRSQSALSQHLAKLRVQELVQTRREAQTIWYRIEPGPAQRIIATLYGIYCVPEQLPQPRKPRAHVIGARVS